MDEYNGAKFSDDRKYRYALWRIWDKRPPIAFIGLNPSTADEINNDPTVRRCINFVKRENAGGLIMLNIFAIRSTSPKILKDMGIEPIGDLNDYHLNHYCAMAERVVIAWGNHGKIGNRGHRVIDMLKTYNLWCFGYTNEGQPKHPLYIHANAELLKA